MLLEDIIAFGEKKTRQILVIGEAETFASQLEKTHPDGSLQVDVVKDGKKSIDKIRSRQFDCIVLDYDVTDVSLDELVREIAKARRLFTPIIVFGGSALNDQEVENIRTNANFFVLRQANWIDRLQIASQARPATATPSNSRRHRALKLLTSMPLPTEIYETTSCSIR